MKCCAMRPKQPTKKWLMKIYILLLSHIFYTSYGVCVLFFHYSGTISLFLQRQRMNVSHGEKRFGPQKKCNEEKKAARGCLCNACVCALRPLHGVFISCTENDMSEKVECMEMYAPQQNKYITLVVSKKIKIAFYQPLFIISSLLRLGFLYSVIL